MARVILPLKDLVQAKTRLAGILSASERRALAQAMVEDVLSVLSGHPEVETVTLISDDPGAVLLAREYGAQHWPEQLMGCRGLNALATAASSRLLAAQPEGAMMVVHGDLPLLAAEDVTAVLSRQKATGGLLIGCDQAGRGTNLLAFDRHCVPQFAFGADSCARHRRWAEQAGVPVAVCRRTGIALDMDEVQDLAALLPVLAHRGDSCTKSLLTDTALGSRLQLALAPARGQREQIKGDLA